MRIAISSGHGLLVRGASGILDEVDEAIKVMNAVAGNLKKIGYETGTFTDSVSTSQNENLHRIVDWHNAQSRELDVSVHFNAYVKTNSGMGTEVLYLTQSDIAQRVVNAISNASGLINRGPKKRTDLYFLNNTAKPAILIETCFVDSQTDCDLYRKYFEQICLAIARVGNKGRPEFYQWEGLVSHFGGPEDTGVDDDEQLAWWSSTEAGRAAAPELFLPYQPAGTTGAARALDPSTSYIAMRFDYQNQWTKQELASGKIMFWVRNPKNGKRYKARPADWGPHIDTDRVADLSPGLLDALELDTDDTVEITLARQDED